MPIQRGNICSGSLLMANYKVMADKEVDAGKDISGCYCFLTAANMCLLLIVDNRTMHIVIN